MRMILAILLAAPLALAADETAPKAETILDHFIEVTGGKAAYEKRHSKVSQGTVEFVGRGIRGQVTEYDEAPDKLYRTAQFEGVGDEEEGVDGKVAWEKSSMQGPRIKEGKERDEAIEEAMFNEPLLWRQIYSEVATKGSEPVEGEDCWKVAAKTRNGKTEDLFFSKKTGLLLKEKAVQTTQMGEIPVETLMSDYRDFSGVLEPATLKQKFAGQELLLRINDIKVNTGIPADRFALPADIQALVEKAKKAEKPGAAASTNSGAANSGGGEFTVYMSGNAVETEKYSLVSADGKYTWSGSGEAHMGPMQMKIQNYTIVTDAKYQPLEADLDMQLGQILRKVKTTFAAGKARSEIASPQGPQIKEDPVSADTVVLAYPVPVFPLAVLARKVSFEPGQTQQLHAYLIGQKEVPVTVKYLGQETVEFANQKADLHHLTGSVTLQPGQEMSMDMWVTDDRQIAKILVPAQKVEVYRQGYDRIVPPAQTAAPADPAPPKSN